MTTPPIRLAVWSGPRNISTALMRAWENRPDTVVVDEPLYSHYLDVTRLDHPVREAVIAAGEPDWRRMAEQLTHGGISTAEDAPAAVHYQKHMTHHLLPDMGLDWVLGLRNVLLLRDPSEVVASYVKSRSSVTVEDIGLAQQVALYDYLVAADRTPPVIDSADFLRSPQTYLRWLCDWIGVAFTDRMLSWPAGRRDSDGVWAPHWYAAVEASTGFDPYRPRDISLTGPAGEVAAAARPLYETLAQHRLLL